MNNATHAPINGNINAKRRGSMDDPPVPAEILTTTFSFIDIELFAKPSPATTA